MIPQIILAILFFVLNVDVIQNNFWMFWGSMFAFGWALISLIYMINFMFNQSEHSFKYSVTTIIAIHLLPLFILARIGITDSGVYLFFFNSMPLFVIGISTGIVLTTRVGEKYKDECYDNLYYLIIQTVVYLSLSILFDYLKCHGFKGNDSMKQTKERTQL